MDNIGRYRLDRRLGAGSFATVWLGHDDGLDVPVAVKVLAENWAANDDVRDRFLAEARIMRRIRDHRIVQVYDIGTLSDGRPYFVMDFIDGGSMDDLRRDRIHPTSALWLCAEACRAIDVLHQNQVIHRDVTPGNLLLSRDQSGATRVVIADLGVAKSMVDVAGATMTAGTPSYMAPEQATGRAALDRRADIYSLTAVTYALLTGSPPFPVRNLADVVTRDRHATPTPIAARLNAPASLDALMVSGLAWDPSRRPPTAALLAGALDGIRYEIQSRSRQAAGTSVQTSTRYFAAERPTVARQQPATPPSHGLPAATEAPAHRQPLPRLQARSRPASYYVLVILCAAAVFMVSMLATILVLR